MRYTLMNRNTKVLELVMTDGIITEVSCVYNSKHIPVSTDNGKSLVSGLNRWLMSRSIPASRNNISEGFELLSSLCGEDADQSYLFQKCFALSLSDQYWINPCDSPVEWEGINFFDNSFSEDTGKILFDFIAVDDPELMSQDNTSDGNIRKKWKIIGGERCLIKGGSLPFRQEPFNERFATLVCDALGITHRTAYEPGCINDEPVSICKNFITRDTEYVTAHALLNTCVHDKNTSAYTHYVNICRNLGVEDIEDRLDEMIVLDYLIGNTDRHSRNFGLIRNAETLEYICAAPLFDNGTSMKCDTATENMFMENEYKLRSKAFRSTHHEQIKIIKEPTIQMSRKIAFFDIDGTLTSETDENIPESVVSSVAKARENGNLMFINTGRCFKYLEQRFIDIGFDGYICGCGTDIYTEAEGVMKSFLHVRQDHDMAEKIFTHARKFRLDLLFESRERLCFDPVRELITDGAKKMNSIFENLGYDTYYDIEREDFVFDKFVIWFEDINDIPKFCSVSDPYFSCIDRGGNFREFVPLGYSKATGIQKVLDYYGLSLNDAYAFGDSNNDLPMLSYVPNSIAMGNASPESLKDMVSYVTDKASENGIEKALEHFGFI